MTTSRRLRIERLEIRQVLATFVVTSGLRASNDSFCLFGGPVCTLSDAIWSAGVKEDGPDRITFNLAASDPTFNAATGQFELEPYTPPPSNFVLNTPVAFDGTTQPGYAGTPKIRINSHSSLMIGLNGAGSSATGISINDLNVAGAGSVITLCDIDRLNLKGAGATVTDSHIGQLNLTAASNSVLHSNEIGLLKVASSHDNTIGSQEQGRGNLINSIELTGTSSTGNKILGNEIRGGYHGIDIVDGASGNVIGGFAEGAGNVIVDAFSYGIYISGANKNSLFGNFIGVLRDGITKVPNGLGGIYVRDSTGVKIGGGTVGSANVISGNTGNGIIGRGVLDELSVKGNYIGTNANGSSALGNSESGLSLAGTGTVVVGGPNEFDRNVISGNRLAGIDLWGEMNAVTIWNNYIGTNKDGTYAIANGVGVSLSTDDVVIKRNLISGNTGDAISASTFSTTGLSLVGNLIGTDVTGQLPLGNGGMTYVGNSATVGGLTPDLRNVISSNGDGLLTGSGSVVLGNYIGLSANGKIRLGNSGDGLGVGSNSMVRNNIVSGNLRNGMLLRGDGIIVTGNTVGLTTDLSAAGNGWDGIFISSGNSIRVGGASASEANVIANNMRSGVYFDVSSVSVRQNIFMGNNGLPIDIGVRGHSQNDSGDADVSYQNYPTLTHWTRRMTPLGFVVDVEGEIDAKPFSTYDVELFSDLGPYLGTVRVTTEANGIGTFSTTVDTDRPIRMTATDVATNETSEFDYMYSGLIFRESSDNGFFGRYGGDIPGFDHVGIVVDGLVYESQAARYIPTGSYYDPQESSPRTIVSKGGVQASHSPGTFWFNSTTSTSTVGEFAFIPLDTQITRSIRGKIQLLLGSPFMPELEPVQNVSDIVNIAQALAPEIQKGKGSAQTFTCIGLIERAAEDSGAVGAFGFLPNAFESTLGVPTLTPEMLYHVVRSSRGQLSFFDQIKGYISGFFDPVDFVLTDPAGRTIDGLNETNTIPNSFYTGNGFLEQILILNPLPGAYALQVTGTGSTANIRISGNSTTPYSLSAEMANGESDLYSLEVESPSGWQNTLSPADVDNSGAIVPLDALRLINELNTRGPRTLSALKSIDDYYLDVNNDGSLSPMDALLVINHLNQRGNGEGEGEGEGEGSRTASIEGVDAWDIERFLTESKSRRKKL